MASKKQILRHFFNGGWATDFGPAANVSPGASGDVVFPFLVDAENVYFELDGGPHKIGGTTRLNSAQLESGAEIMGVFDYWRHGTAGTPVQKRVVHVSTKIKADAADGTFADIKTGVTDNAVPCYTTFNDVLIISSSATGDTPFSWDQTTFAALAGSPPNFAFHCAHKNRLWASGNPAFPSRLYYSGLLDHTDWSGATSGSIDIDPDDGDRVTAIVSHKNELIVFKGPYFGSIHRITGSSPTGSDAFARLPFIRGVGAVAHNSLFRFRDDVGFMWQDGSIHSLNATASYGDFAEVALSRPIHSYLRDNLNFSALNRVSAASHARNSMVLICVPVGSSTFCNQILMLDHSKGDFRWSQWPALNGNCAALVIDSSASNQPRIFIGGTDGYVRRTMITGARSIDGTTGITAKVTTPFTNYGNAMVMKTLSGASVGIAPHGAHDMTLQCNFDTNSPAATATITQSTSVGLGGTTGFTLDVSTLGGSAYRDVFIEEMAGEFRSIQYQAIQSGVNEDMELHSISAEIEADSSSMENF